MTCAINFGQVTPKFVKIWVITSMDSEECWDRPPYAAAGRMSLTALERENQRVNRDGFRQSHAEDAERKHASEGAGVAAHSFSSLRSNKTDSNAGSSPAMPRVKLPVMPAAAAVAASARNRKDHNVILLLCCLVFSPSADLHGPGGEISNAPLPRRETWRAGYRPRKAA